MQRECPFDGLWSGEIAVILVRLPTRVEFEKSLEWPNGFSFTDCTPYNVQVGIVVPSICFDRALVRAPAISASTGHRRWLNALSI